MIGQFLNVDLDIESDRSLALLRREFASFGALVLYCGRIPTGHLLRIEAEHVQRTKPDRTLIAICRLVERLSPKARKIWDAARSRSFDIGIDGTSDHQSARVLVPHALVQRVGALGGTLTITVYRPDNGTQYRARELTRKKP